MCHKIGGLGWFLTKFAKMLYREDLNWLLIVIYQAETDCGRLALTLLKIIATQETADTDQAAAIWFESVLNPAASLRSKPFR